VARQHRRVQPEPVIYREEATAMLFAIADMNANIRAIRDLLEEGDGGEEGLPQDDA
jgi:hypothetical protein